MKDIKILHLFPGLMSLYGEYGNVAVVKNTLEKHGYGVSLTEYESGDLPDLSDFDFIYTGSGTEASALESVRRLLRFKEAVCDSINSGTVWLSTGNSMCAFGKSLKYDSEISDACGCFDYTSEILKNTRFSGDVLSSENNILNSAAVGYINTSCAYYGITDPLFELILNRTFGNDKQSPFDGMLVNNFFATQLIGPVLVKNPAFLTEIILRITGRAIEFPEDTFLYKAWKSSVSGLKGRVRNI